MRLSRYLNEVRLSTTQPRLLTSASSRFSPRPVHGLHQRFISAPTPRMSGSSKYSAWEKDRLISRIQQLEGDLKAAKALAAATSGPGTPSDAPAAKKRKTERNIDGSQYNTRFIALKLAYLGKKYGGFEHQASSHLPTIESVLWSALVKSVLVFPTGDSGEDAPVDFESCEYSKCGRTDRGVSAFGQVIGIRVRSSKPLDKPKPEPANAEGQAASDVKMTEFGETKTEAEAEEPPPPPKKEWHHIEDELPYVRMLNKLLPPDIRILAWCPSPPPGFSARFSCIERQYRYFFTQPACSPALNSHDDKDKPRSGWLDIEAMRTAARSFVGEHDFRNFCKVDGSKQITNFRREIFEVSITEVEDGIGSALPYVGRPELSAPGISDSDKAGQVLPKVYSFNVRGSAFLWHQIRMMVSVLFNVGQGFESPSMVADLLDLEKYPRKPNYQLAHDVPLVLWDCLFPEGEGNADALTWYYETEKSKHLAGGVVPRVWEMWRGHKMDEILSNRLLEVVAQKQQHTTPAEAVKPRQLYRIFLGDDEGRPLNKYHPLKTRQFAPEPAEVNNRWAQRKGFQDSEDMKAAGHWRAARKAAAAEDGAAGKGDE